MLLPSDFQFSQASLQDFVDCPRRFLLRYLLDVAWPAVQSEPILEFERWMRQGQVFHLMIQQHILGIAEERLSAMVSDADLERWWRNYCIARPADLPEAEQTARRYPEIALTASLAQHRLVAKYDLVMFLADGSVTIFDWKTSRRRPRSSTLKRRMQTRVYRYLLLRAGNYLHAGTPLDPQKVSMIYWFAEFPDSPERLPYSAAQYREDEAELTALIEGIRSMEEGDFKMTVDENRCKYCSYRSYCDRGVKAGLLDAADEDVEAAESEDLDLADFDFEQIAEIAF